MKTIRKLLTKTMLFILLAAFCFPSHNIAENTAVDPVDQDKVAALKNIVAIDPEVVETLYELEKKERGQKRGERRRKRWKKIKYFTLGTAFGLTGLGILAITALYIAMAGLGRGIGRRHS